MPSGSGSGSPVTIVAPYAYASPSDVAMLCINLLEGASAFSASTIPALTSVSAWLDSGAAVINSWLSSHGYDTPITTGVAMYDMLTDLNMLYAAARSEMSRINVTLAPGERTRGQVFDAMFWAQLNALAKADLSSLGATSTTRGQIYVGGIGVTDKQNNVDDTDRVTPRFTRDKFRFPGTI